MGNYDIVYILKSDVEPEELRYSLRSVCQNFPYNRIIFIGGKPDGIEPDIWIPHRQKGISVWERSTSSVMVACTNKKITDNFWLFNDDFFIMHPCEDFKTWYNGTLQERIDEIEHRIGAPSLYTRQLRRTKEELRERNLKEYNYAVHVPMLINKKQGLEVLNSFKSPMFKSVYGNRYSVSKIDKKDVKISDRTVKPNKRQKVLSTTETSFNKGEVGAYIRSKFPEPCKYEVENGKEI